MSLRKLSLAEGLQELEKGNNDFYLEVSLLEVGDLRTTQNGNIFLKTKVGDEKKTATLKVWGSSKNMQNIGIVKRKPQCIRIIKPIKPSYWDYEADLWAHEDITKIEEIGKSNHLHQDVSLFEKANEIFDEALKVARSISDKYWRSRALAKIAETIAIPEVKIEIPKRILTEKDELEILLNSSFEVENALVEFEGIKIEPISIKKLKSEKIKIKPNFEPGMNKLKIRVSFDFEDTRQNIEKEFDLEFRATQKVEEKPKLEKMEEKAEEEKKFLKYKIMALAGGGAFADVYKAIDENGNTVALKIYRESEKAFIEEIGNFVQLTKRLNIPYIVKPLDFGSNPKPFVVMQFYPMTLRDLMRINPDLKKKLRFMHRVAKALSYAHSHKIYHGDLKPENVLVFEENGEYYPAIADWGGGYTPCYSAPELYRSDGRNLNAKSDVYSFGVILFELLTGESLFADPLDYLERCDNVTVKIGDKRLEEIVNSCLSKPELRPGMEEIRDRIADYLLNVLGTRYSKSLMSKDALEVISAYLDSGKIETAEMRIKAAERLNLIPNKVLVLMDKIIGLMKLPYEYRGKNIPLEVFEQRYKGIVDLLDQEIVKKLSWDKFSLANFIVVGEGIPPDSHDALLLCIDRLKDVAIAHYLHSLS